MTTGTTVPTTGTEVVVARRVLTIDRKNHLPRIEVSCERGKRQRQKDAKEGDQRDYSTQKDSVMVAYRQLRRRLEARIRDTTITVVEASCLVLPLKSHSRRQEQPLTVSM
jgi:hypothetical protein